MRKEAWSGLAANKYCISHIFEICEAEMNHQNDFRGLKQPTFLKISLGLFHMSA